MRQIQSERVFLNMAGKETSQTARLTLRLQDSVDGAVLKEAVLAPISDYRERHGYLKKGRKKVERAFVSRVR